MDIVDEGPLHAGSGGPPNPVDMRALMLAALAQYEYERNEQTLSELQWTLEGYRTYAPDLFAAPGGGAWSEPAVQALLTYPWRYVQAPAEPRPAIIIPGRQGEKRAAPDPGPAERACRARFNQLDSAS